jgi:hypothetical protein
MSDSRADSDDEGREQRPIDVSWTQLAAIRSHEALVSIQASAPDSERRRIQRSMNQVCEILEGQQQSQDPLVRAITSHASLVSRAAGSRAAGSRAQSSTTVTPVVQRNRVKVLAG